MVTTIEAIYDRQALHPKDRLTLEPNTPVRITIETVEPTVGKTAAWDEFFRPGDALAASDTPTAETLTAAV